MAVVQLSIVGKILKVKKLSICHNCLRKLTHPLQSFSASASILIHPQNLFELILRLIDSLQIILACKIRRHILSCHPVVIDIKPHEAASVLYVRTLTWIWNKWTSKPRGLDSYQSRDVIDHRHFSKLWKTVNFSLSTWLMIWQRQVASSA